MTVPLSNGLNGHSHTGAPSQQQQQQQQRALPVVSQQPTPSASAGTAKVLIVGGGPAGIVSLRNFLQDESAEGGKKGLNAVLYERREEVGGVWYLDPTTLGLEEKNGYPSNRWPIATPSQLLYPSPSYPALIGNVFHRFLTFSGHPFEQPADRFPTLEETYRYLASVVQPLRNHVRTKRDVKQVWELPHLPALSGEEGALPRSGGWLVRTADLSTNPPTNLYEQFSAISFCPSFTTHPSYPNVPGLAAAMRLAPRKIHHAKWYRTVEPFWRSKKVVVVGNGLSSNDIAAQIVGRRRREWGEEMREGEEQVLRALRHDYVDMFPSLPDVRYRDIPHITRIDLRSSNNSSEPSLDITLASGEVVTDVDHLIWGTGYQIGVYDWVNVLAREPTHSDVAALGEAGITLDGDRGWKIEDHLNQESLAQATTKLESLWVQLTPPARYPTEDKSKSARAPVPTVTTSSPNPEPLDLLQPNRVPHLHSHMMSARNPTLAFGALIISATPFVLADLVSRYIRLVWEAEPSSGKGHILPSTFEERRKDEISRFHELEKTRADLEAGNADALSGSETDDSRIKPKNVVTVNGTFLPALPPSGLLSFHVLRDQEFPLQCRFRDTFLQYKPWLRNVVGLRDEEWEEVEREGHRKSMYTEKRKWLQHKRDQERLESQAKGTNWCS